MNSVYTGTRHLGCVRYAHQEYPGYRYTLRNTPLDVGIALIDPKHFIADGAPATQ